MSSRGTLARLGTLLYITRFMYIYSDRLCTYIVYAILVTPFGSVFRSLWFLLFLLLPIYIRLAFCSSSAALCSVLCAACCYCLFRFDCIPSAAPYCCPSVCPSVSLSVKLSAWLSECLMLLRP